MFRALSSDRARRRRPFDLHPVLGFNFKLTNLQAAVGLAQLEKLERRVSFARERDHQYREGLADCPGIILPPVDTAGGEILQWTDALIERRDSVRKALDEAGIGYRAFWLPVHAHNPYAAPATRFPNATRASAWGMWLPSAYSLSREDIARTCDVIRKALERARDEL